MLTTKRYDYMSFDAIKVHPDVGNHRPLDQRKVIHYSQDILQNGLLEPLVVWEKKAGEAFLVGGFHRMAAIRKIRESNPGYFDRIDVRVVAGEVDEIRALNLKLNADRVDTKISDYFDVVIYLNNANWSKERIGEFLDRSPSLIADIIRYVPILDGRIRRMLEDGKISWNKAKSVARAVQDAPAGREREVLEQQLAALNGNGASNGARKRPVTFRSAKKRLSQHAEKNPEATYQLNTSDLLSLLLVLEGKQYQPNHLERVRSLFPQLLDA
jgi:ParB family chromosome partitioning protein